MIDLAAAALYYRSRVEGIIVDTNILLLLIVGTFARDRIPSFGRTEHFTAADYDLLTQFLRIFDAKLFVTPHILAEVSNLSSGAKGKQLLEYFAALRALIGVLNEEFVPASEAAEMPTYASLGLTDSAIFSLAAKRYLVLTDDFTLYGYLTANERHALNFNQMRDLPTS